MSTFRTWPEQVGGWLGLTSHLDDWLDVPRPWRILRGIAVLVAAFVGAMWPDVTKALLRAAVALLSVGAVAWVFNLAFWVAWRPTYEKVRRVQRLLHEAAQLVDRDPKSMLGDSHASAEHAWRWLKIKEFIRHSLKHSASMSLDQFIKAEEERHHDSDAPTTTFPLGRTTARFLHQLADELKANEIRQDFLLPESFDQYASADKWPGVKP